MRNQCLLKVPRYTLNMHKLELGECRQYLGCSLDQRGMMQIRDNRCSGVNLLQTSKKEARNSAMHRHCSGLCDPGLSILISARRDFNKLQRWRVTLIFSLTHPDVRSGTKTWYRLI